MIGDNVLSTALNVTVILNTYPSFKSTVPRSISKIESGTTNGVSIV